MEGFLYGIISDRSGGMGHKMNNRKGTRTRRNMERMMTFGSLDLNLDDEDWQ